MPENVIVVLAVLFQVYYVLKMYQALALDNVVYLCVIDYGIALSMQP